MNAKFSKVQITISEMNESPVFWDEHYRLCKNIWAGSVSLPKYPSGTKVLEAGCGNGKTLASMKETGWDITAFDFSKEAALLSRKNSPGFFNADIFVSDASYLPFKDEVFDLVFARHITGHSKKKKRDFIAGELIRVLKSGGELHFVEFEISDMRNKKETFLEDNTFLNKNGIITHFFSEDEVRNLLSKVNEKFIQTEKWPLKIKGKDYQRAEINAVFEK